MLVLVLVTVLASLMLLFFEYSIVYFVPLGLSELSLKVSFPATELSTDVTLGTLGFIVKLATASPE